MLSKKINLLLFTALLGVFAVSCSTDDEVIEQQGPQSQISSTLATTAAENVGKSMAVETFQDQVSWYENVDPSICGIDGMILAYEVFDQENNSLSTITIGVWFADSGLTLQDSVEELAAAESDFFGQEINLVFVSGYLLTFDGEDATVAEVNSYTTFADYFDDCQSDAVVFEDFNGQDLDLLFVEAPEAEEVEFPSLPCLALEFPLDILVAQDDASSSTFEVTVSEIEFIDYISGNIAGLVVIDFVYPVSLVTADGTEFSANSMTELEQLFEQACE